MIDKDTLSDRVANGVQFLADVVGPKWRSKIDSRKLDMSQYTTCIAGQLAGPEGAVSGTHREFSLFEEADCDAQKLVDMGFDLSPDDFKGSDREDAYALLTKAWKAELK